MIDALAILHVLVLFSVAFIVWRKQEASTVRIFFWPALLFKLSAGIVLGLMYQHYYLGGDTFIFFRDAKQLSGLFRTDTIAYFQFLWSGNDAHAIWTSLSEIQPRSLFFTKIISLINVLTFDNYWITGLYLSFISFLASWYFVKKILILFPDGKSAASFAVLFFPTIVFWSSGMVKESLAVAALFFMAGLFLTFIKRLRPNAVEWILLPISLWMLWTLKYYWAVVFLPAFVSTLLVQNVILNKMNSSKFIIQCLVWMLLFLVICSGAMLVHPNFYPEYFLQVIVDNNHVLGSLSDPQNVIHFYDLQPTWTSVLLNSPWALFSGLVRPFLFEGGNIVKLLYAVENSILLILLLSSLWRLKRMRSSSFRVLTFAVIVYVGILCVFLALSTPNFGTLARYRVGFLPFLIFLVTYKNPLLEKVWGTKQD